MEHPYPFMRQHWLSDCNDCMKAFMQLATMFNWGRVIINIHNPYWIEDKKLNYVL